MTRINSNLVLRARNFGKSFILLGLREKERGSTEIVALTLRKYNFEHRNTTKPWQLYR